MLEILVILRKAV